MATIEENEDKELEKQRNDQNNANNIRNAADVAIASKNPYGVAIGGAVKAADKVTGGKSTEALGKAMTRANKIAPGGRRLQNASNKLSESGASDKIGKAASMYNNKGAQGAGGTGPTQNQVVNKNNMGGEQNGSLPSSLSKKDNNNLPVDNSKSSGGKNADIDGSSSKSKSNKSSLSTAEESYMDREEKEKKEKRKALLKLSLTIKVVALIFGPVLIILLFLVVAVGMVTSLFSEYDDAFGISQTVGEETGNVYFEAGDPSQQDFYDRINDVKLEYQANGKSVDALKIVAVYHILNSNGADIKYDDMTTSKIKKIADAMFDGNIYNEELFKNNLKDKIIPSYLSGTTANEREQMVNDIFDYIERYYNLIGKDTTSSCSGTGNCSYDIKGFYINGKGNVSKNIKAENIKVRLMECGSPYGNGSYTKPIDQPLVDFESYVGGVAYAEIGTSAPAEAIKAQMVAARSFALARPTESGNSFGKKLEKENDQWILQISSCVADQVFCNIDQGCSYMGGGDGQGGIVKSGIVSGASKTRGPVAQEDPFRSYLSETQGEVLVNAQGYVIETGYLSTEQNQFIALANKGLNYKQILLQVYNQGSRNYGASDIQKASCDSGNSASCISSGEFANWKQYEGPWISVPMGNSGKTIKDIGCLATSVSILIAKSGVPTNISNFNPGTFVEYLNSHGGFAAGGNFLWGSATMVAPSFKYQSRVELSGMSRQQKLNTIKGIVSQKGVYAVCEVKGNTGQHWVAIDSVVGDTINMMDPGSKATDMWAQYNWANTSAIVYFKVG